MLQEARFDYHAAVEVESLAKERDRERERKAAEAARQVGIERKRAELAEVLGPSMHY